MDSWSNLHALSADMYQRRDLQAPYQIISCSRSSTPQAEPREVVEQVVDCHAAVGSDGARAVVHVSGILFEATFPTRMNQE